MKWITKKGDMAQQLTALLILIDRIYKSKEKILDSIIDTVPGLKDYMLIHSVFDISDNDQSDWLAAYMIDKLNYTFVPKKQNIPQEILDKLKIFNPEEVEFMQDYVVLTYGMWKKGSNGRLLDPINTNYWSDIQDKPVDMVPIIESYTPLSFDDDLPF